MAWMEPSEKIFSSASRQPWGVSILLNLSRLGYPSFLTGVIYTFRTPSNTCAAHDVPTMCFTIIVDWRVYCLLTLYNKISAIGRNLIPRYFRSIFEGGVTELSYYLKHPRESFHNTSITLECDACTMVTVHGHPSKSMYTKVTTTRTTELTISFKVLTYQLT